MANMVVHAMPELLGVPRSPFTELWLQNLRGRRRFSHEVGGPGFEYAAHELTLHKHTHIGYTQTIMMIRAV